MQLQTIKPNAVGNVEKKQVQFHYTRFALPLECHQWSGEPIFVGHGQPSVSLGSQWQYRKTFPCTCPRRGWTGRKFRFSNLLYDLTGNQTHSSGLRTKQVMPNCLEGTHAPSWGVSHIRAGRHGCCSRLNSLIMKTTCECTTLLKSSNAGGRFY